MSNSISHGMPFERSHTTDALPGHALGSYLGSSRGSGFNSNNGGGGHATTRSSHRDRRHHCGGNSGGHRHPGFTPGSGGSTNYGSLSRGGSSLVSSPSPQSLGLIHSMAGDALLFSETNMDWTKLNIFRTRLCDRLTQTHSCHMVNRCLFSHDVNWPRRTPFLPRATALTLRYIPVWCPRLEWPPLVGMCDSSGKISWASHNDRWDARFSHQNCTRGDNCPFVHNLEEFLYHPEVYKTRSCCLANDDNFEEQMNNSSMALCPWYFCPFAHDIYELRDLRGTTKYAWHPPPQIVDNQFVARTQGFDELEMQIIDFIRKAPNGAADLYTSAVSPLRILWRDRMPPVIRPMRKSLIERLKPSNSHLQCQFDELLYVMIIASLLNLLLYPVENFYVPTLLSLQCALLRFQMDLPVQQYEAAWLVQQYDLRKMTGAPSAGVIPTVLSDAPHTTTTKAVDNAAPVGPVGSASAEHAKSPPAQPLIPTYQKSPHPFYSQISSSGETATPGGSRGHNGSSNASFSPVPSSADMSSNGQRNNFPMFQYLLGDEGANRALDADDETHHQRHPLHEISPSSAAMRISGSQVAGTQPGETESPNEDLNALAMPNFHFDSSEEALPGTISAQPDEKNVHARDGSTLKLDRSPEEEEEDLPPGVIVPKPQPNNCHSQRKITDSASGVAGKVMNEELCAILELLEPEELLQMMELISASSPIEGAGAVEAGASNATALEEVSAGAVSKPQEAVIAPASDHEDCEQKF